MRNRTTRDTSAEATGHLQRCGSANRRHECTSSLNEEKNDIEEKGGSSRTITYQAIGWMQAEQKKFVHSFRHQSNAA
jgi:hypothetical protein